MVPPVPGSGSGAMAAERSAAEELQPEGQGAGELAGGFRQLLEEEEEEGAEDAGYVLYRYGRGGAGPGPERPGRGSPRRGREGGGGAEPYVR